jgi:serine protease AprX
VIAAVFSVLLAAGLAWSGADTGYAEAQQKIHPAIEAFMAVHPGSDIPVIIGAADPGGNVAGDAVSKGAEDVTSLGMVDAVAATVTTSELWALAGDADVAFVALDPVMVSSGKEDDFSSLRTTYPRSVNAVPAWQQGVTGDNVTVAVIDSGLTTHKDLQGAVVGAFDLSTTAYGTNDENGHGTYVAGIIAGDSKKYSGIAPDANILSLKVSGREGSALASDVIVALQWVVDHKSAYDIRVVNLSMNSSIADSYREDPLAAAVEQAWNHGVVVVTSAGNYGSDPFAVDHAPANDPYVITVGALDDKGTNKLRDDSVAAWSSRGVTVDGYAKPEVVAPGVDIVSTLAEHSSFASNPAVQKVEGKYVELSGTSASAAVVSGAVALILDQQPWLTPDQVKARLVDTARTADGARAVDASAAVFSTKTGTANTTAQPNSLIDPTTGDIAYGSVLWRSVLWRSVLWRSVLWRN